MVALIEWVAAGAYPLRLGHYSCLRSLYIVKYDVSRITDVSFRLAKLEILNACPHCTMKRTFNVLQASVPEDDSLHTILNYYLLWPHTGSGWFGR